MLSRDWVGRKRLTVRCCFKSLRIAIHRNVNSKLYLQNYLLVGPVYPLVASASVLGSVSSGLPFENLKSYLKSTCYSLARSLENLNEEAILPELFISRVL